MIKPSCGPRGAGDLLNALNDALAKHAEIWGKVTITPCGCLGPCQDGPSMVVYPDGTWYCGLKPAEIQEVIESHLVGGKPVDRLTYKFP